MSKLIKSHGRLSQSASLKPRELMTNTPRLAKAWCAKVITLFPDAFPGVLGASLTGKALAEGLWALEPVDLRTFGSGKHRQVDDTPAGGGAGLVLRPDIMGRALDMASAGTPADRSEWPIVYLSPRGKPFDQRDAERFSKTKGMTLVCGRFEGLDQRVIDHYDMEEVSIGDFVLTGGEIAAQALLDATVRLIPGVLGNKASTEEESFSDGLLEHPQFTKPADWRGHEIPPVLLSGDHGKVAQWRRAEAEALTKARRPDLWDKHEAKQALNTAYRNPPRLRTERLLLRPLRLRDQDDIVRLIGDFEVSKWLEPVPHPYSCDDARWFLAEAKTGALGMVWAIEADGAFIGVIGAGPGLGYWLAPQFWGKGLMSEAAQAAVGAYFEASQAHSIRSRYFEKNARSAHVLAKLGFVEIGPGMTFSKARNAEVPCRNMELTRTQWLERTEGAQSA